MWIPLFCLNDRQMTEFFVFRSQLIETYQGVTQSGLSRLTFLSHYLLCLDYSFSNILRVALDVSNEIVNENEIFYCIK